MDLPDQTHTDILEPWIIGNRQINRDHDRREVFLTPTSTLTTNAQQHQDEPQVNRVPHSISGGQWIHPLASAAGQVSNALTSIKKLAELTGKKDFAPWDTSVLGAISQLRLIGHIRSDGDAMHDLENVDFCTQPIVALPIPTDLSSVEQIEEWGHYSANNNSILQILLSRMSDSVFTSLPGADQYGVCCTAKDLYAAVKRQYSLGNTTVIKASKVTLENYNTQTMVLTRACPTIDWHDIIHHLGKGLPDTSAILSIKDHLLHGYNDTICLRSTFDSVYEMVSNCIVTWSSTHQKSSLTGGANRGEKNNNDSRKRWEKSQRQRCATPGWNWWGEVGKRCPHDGKKVEAVMGEEYHSKVNLISELRK
ncbi:hypothetical protein E1B28_000798 [Marasmius oreades]|uniref:Uncharacterized protein n=1 Tax=Marasmius oreades TaxID=181124 RepID=A0A9P7V278_9AGAR|nr:uncharacterized protein E1B28_000798 [Marasmius oreades]KAG7098898.1 hypothetical protein E1B28_000798 [Marasmius oreades]